MSPDAVHLGGQSPKQSCGWVGPHDQGPILGSWRPPEAHGGLFPLYPFLGACHRELRCRTAVWGPLQGGVHHIIQLWDRAFHRHRFGQSLGVPRHCPKPSGAPFAQQCKGGSLENLMRGSLHLVRDVATIFCSYSVPEAVIQWFILRDIYGPDSGPLYLPRFSICQASKPPSESGHLTRPSWLKPTASTSSDPTLGGRSPRSECRASVSDIPASLIWGFLQLAV